MDKRLRLFLSMMALCGLLLTAPTPQLWAGQQAQLKQDKRPAKKTRRAPRQKPSAPEKPKLTKEELLSPYSSQAESQGDRQNATRLFFEPAPEGRPFADTKKDDLGLNLRLGRERLIDPLTGEEIKTRADQAGAKGGGKSLDLKGTLDKLGGKAEVQVDLLKF